MAKRKSVTEMSAKELYALAKKIERVEKKTSTVNKEKIASLKKQRTLLERNFAKEIAKIDRQLKKLGGPVGGTVKRRRRSKVSLADHVLELLAGGPMSSADMRAALTKKRVNAKYLGQALTTLKSRGAIKSPSRAVYELA